MKMQDAPTFMRYFNHGKDKKEIEALEDKPMPKFMLFSNHAETMAAILHSFDFPMLLIEPSYMVLVNFYLDTSSYNVDLKLDKYSSK